MGDAPAGSPPGHAAPTAVTQPPKPPDEHRIVLERGRRVDCRIQHLIVAGRAEAKLHTDGLLLGTRMPPRATLEGQHHELPLGELLALALIGSLGLVHRRNPRRARPEAGQVARQFANRETSMVISGFFG